LLTANGENAALSGGLGNAITHYSLHTGNPGSSGTNEVTGGSPAYARKAATWAAAASGLRSNSVAAAFDVPGSTTVYFAGAWDALTSGNFYGYSGIGTSLLNGVGTAAAIGDVITAPAHGLANNDRVFISDAGLSLPGGLAEGTVYYVVGASTDTFQLSATSAGSAVDITSVGTVNWSQTKPEVFGSQGTLTIPIGGFVLDATPGGTA
jgi:hypothetical protein